MGWSRRKAGFWINNLWRHNNHKPAVKWASFTSSNWRSPLIPNSHPFLSKNFLSPRTSNFTLPYSLPFLSSLFTSHLSASHQRLGEIGKFKSPTRRESDLTWFAWHISRVTHLLSALLSRRNLYLFRLLTLLRRPPPPQNSGFVTLHTLHFIFPRLPSPPPAYTPHTFLPFLLRHAVTAVI